MKKKLIPILKKYAMMTAGALLYAAGIALFLAPNNLASGGVSGLSIIIVNFIDIFPIGVWVLLLNIPIMAVGIWKLGWKILIPTVYSVAISSTMMSLLEAYAPAVTYNPVLACVGGASLAACGVGLVFRGGGTTGGTDIIVKLLRLRFRHMSTGSIFLFVDGVVVLTSGIVFGNIEKALFAAIAVFIQTMVLNTVLYGSDEARMVYIISNNDSVIARRFLKELDAGATYLYGNGVYSGDDKKVLMCVLRMRMLPQAREIVREEDTNAFMIVTKATSVFGEGFKSYNEDEL